MYVCTTLILHSVSRGVYGNKTVKAVKACYTHIPGIVRI